MTDTFEAETETELVARIAPLGRFEPEAVLRRGEDRLVVAGRFAGTRVVVKRFARDGAARVLALQEELDAVMPEMATGRLRMMRCLAVLPEHGLAILQRVPGVPLQDALEGASPEERAGLVRMAGDWLRRYTDTRRREARFGPRHWVARCEARDAGALSAEDAALADSLVAGLRARVPALRGAPLIRAATHGDFTAANLHWDGECLWGVDVQGESWLPLAKEAALFLVWLELRRDDGEGARIHGIRAEDWKAFLRSGLLSRAEAEGVLPFLVGEALHHQFIRAYAHARQRDRLRDAIRGWLDQAKTG
ncbi:hypothetical protein E0K89_007400 [Aquicoccus sp. SCR17]|nr:hypothetical protein [Carideicomes alvinocaridis]